MTGHPVLAEFLAVTGEGRPHAVLDPAWPTRLRRDASDDLERALAEGRVGQGDIVVFTSGSTGRPRGVVRTLASWRESVAPLGDLAGIGAGDVVWVPGPLSSSLSLHAAWHAVQRGAVPVVQRRPPGDATVLHAVPALLAEAVDAAEAGLLPQLRVAVVAGDALPPRLRDRAAALGWRVLEYYGAAELSFVAWRTGTGPFLAFPSADVELRDARIWVRSPYLARGYLDRQDAAPLRWDGRWATVGDRGAADAGGLRLLGRGTAVVTTGGSTVVVAEVEGFLRGQPGVEDLAILGVPHGRLGELVTAIVVPTGDSDWRVLRGRLRDAVRALPPAARPRRWHRADALPRTSTGKLDRGDLGRCLTGGSALSPTSSTG